MEEGKGKGGGGEREGWRRGEGSVKEGRGKGEGGKREGWRREEGGVEGEELRRELLDQLAGMDEGCGFSNDEGGMIGGFIPQS